MFLSVIIPVYKAEHFLDRCVGSILAQKVDDMEILLVNDGSPDRSGELCDEWALKDSSIHVLHKQNGGPGSARNMALDIAQGTYITFVDSDDALADSTLSSLTGYLTTHPDTDILEYPAHLYIGSQKERMLSFRDSTYDISTTEQKHRLWLEQSLYAHSYSCNKVFHRSLFEDIRYSEQATLGEDVRLMSQLVKKAKTYSVTSSGLYLYYFNNDSISGSLKYADQLLSSHLYAIEQLGINLYDKPSRHLYLTLLNFQIDVYRFAKTVPAEPILRKNPIPLCYARNKKGLVKILLLRLLGIKLMCRLLKYQTHITTHRSLFRRYSSIVLLFF